MMKKKIVYFILLIFSVLSLVLTIMDIRIPFLSSTIVLGILYLLIIDKNKGD
ncbi:hypothetical protein D922_03148 [Enterococcus faecalis 06-MB-DW-09]|nr:hypothetical protein D922_03148 [Enterococcus faecalis 06-MB-DW-09]